MTSIKKQELIEQLITQGEGLSYPNKNSLDALIKKSEMYIRNIFGETSKYLDDLQSIRFYPMIYPADEAYHNRVWSSGVAELNNLYKTMKEEVVLFGSDLNGKIPTELKSQTIPSSKQQNKSKIFIVHGHKDSIKSEVARFLEKLGLEAIILHEKASNGKTVIEKFEYESSGVNFAVVLLTGDDRGARVSNFEDSKLRARQNVIFEFGYFVGIMGRSKVVALIEEGVEIPSDYSGVIYLPLDNSDAWKLGLAKELKNAGIAVDLNLVV